MCQTFATCYSTLIILARYGQQLHNIYYYFIPVFSLVITDISLSPSSHLCLLYLSFTAHQSPMATTQRCWSHQRPPLDAADHLSSLFRFEFFFSFFFFPFTFFGCGLMGEFGWANRWWVGSVGDRQLSGGGWVSWWWQIGGGADLCSDLFLSLFFCFGGGFGGGCGLTLVVVVFFFFPGDCGHNNFSGCCCCCW